VFRKDMERENFSEMIWGIIKSSYSQPRLPKVRLGHQVVILRFKQCHCSVPKGES